MKFTFLIFLCGIIFFSCGDGSNSNRYNEKPVITVTLLPQKYFVDRISGKKFDVNVMIPPGHNPATYSPTPIQLRTVNHSVLYLRSGYILFETAWLNNIISNIPGIKVVDTSKGVDFIKGNPDHHHDGNMSDQDPKTGIDPHIWLSPKAVKIQVKNILDAIIEIDNSNRSFYEKNYNDFINDINLLDQEIATLLKSKQMRKFMVFHPAWGYFARDYGLEQFSVEGEGKSPSPGEIKNAIDTARKEDIHIIFIQKQFDSNIARAIAEDIKGEVIVLDPLAEDWLDNMKKLAKSLSQVLK